MVRQHPSEPPCVLLEDDNLETLDVTASHLRAQGARVVAASSPFGVTNIVRREQPDVIVLDVMMPGLSGSGLGAIIRSQSDAPIVYFSSMPEESLRDLTRETVNATYVLKSEGISFLAEEIERTSRRRNASSRALKPKP